MQNRTLQMTAATAALLALGCSDPVEPAMQELRLADGVNGAGMLAVYNSGIDRSVGASPCRDERHREFDFWVGTWEMGGDQRSVVRSLLDGCMIEENYMPPLPPAAPGAPPGPLAVLGRSINAYDRDTGKWHQTWISFVPRGHLRMSGNLVDGVMRMGMQAGGFSIQYSWARVGATQVVQSSSFGGATTSLLYSPLADVSLVPPITTTNCTAETTFPGGATNRQIDFLAGDWDVSNDHGAALGSARFAPDMSGCLMREDYTTAKGYAAHSYIYHDLNSGGWHRTYIDSEAERAELFGRMIGGALVLFGAEAAPGGGVVQVRNTIRPLEDGSVLQTWETSTDAVTWKVDISLTFTPR